MCAIQNLPVLAVSVAERDEGKNNVQSFVCGNMLW